MSPDRIHLALVLLCLALLAWAEIQRRRRAAAEQRGWDEGYARGYTDALTAEPPEMSHRGTGLLRVFPASELLCDICGKPADDNHGPLHVTQRVR